MSAVEESSNEPAKIINVLVALHPGFDLLDYSGPYEFLHDALHNPKDRCMESLFFGLPITSDPNRIDRLLTRLPDSSF